MNESFLSSLFTNPFLQNALIAIGLASIASGLMGSYVVAKKISSISGSIAHSILGGIGFCLWLKYKFQLDWLDPLYGAFIAALLSALLIGWVHLRHAQKEDAAIATIWSTGMGIGVIFISLVPSFGADFTHFLFGNVLLVSKSNLYLLLFLNSIILISILLYHQHFLALCFDEEMASLQNVKVSFLYLLLLSLISISIVLLIQIIGIILVIALLTIPPTIATTFVKKLSLIMIISIILCLIFNFTGLVISYNFNWPPGATIAIIAALGYLSSLVFHKKVS